MRLLGLELKCRAELFRNAVPDPMTVPPFRWIHGESLKKRAEVQVVTSSQACLPRSAYCVSDGDFLPYRNIHGRKMAVNALEPIAVIDNNSIAVNSEISGKHNDSTVGRRNGGMSGSSQIVS